MIKKKKISNGVKLVSACLLGVNCRYNGKNKLNKKIVEFCQKEKCLAVCPEAFGKLPIPRQPAEIFEGDGKDVLIGKAKVKNKNGKDVTKEFILGANKCLKLAKAFKVKEVILKSNSPSCGSGKIYDGTFSGKLKKGDGVTAALLKQNRIKVKTENEF